MHRTKLRFGKSVAPATVARRRPFEGEEATMKGYQSICAIGLVLCALPTIAQAQAPATTPQQYCTALAKEVDRYIASSHGESHLAVQSYGEASCKRHDAEDAIPILERRLEANKLPLPPHTASVASRPSRGTMRFQGS